MLGSHFKTTSGFGLLLAITILPLGVASGDPPMPEPYHGSVIQDHVVLEGLAAKVHGEALNQVLRKALKAMALVSRTIDTREPANSTPNE